MVPACGSLDRFEPEREEPAAATGADAGGVKSFYDLRVPSLEGDTVDLAPYRGKVTLVVNVASQCGCTPRYSGLENRSSRRS